MLENRMTKNGQANFVVLNHGQKLNEILCEIDRIEAVLNYYLLNNAAQRLQVEPKNRVKVAVLLAQIQRPLIKKVHKFNAELKARIRDEFNELKKFLDVKLTKAEKAMIVKAMALGQGHWYECPNGHVYAIGECGGAMESTKCPDCGATIGGRNHRLEGGNRLAGHMDGASSPAWPI